MRAVRVISGRGVPLKRSDVDTDQIIPAEWLKRVECTGFDKGLFSEWRDDRDFVLNKEEHLGAKVLVAGPNFGTGSSREHAVWAIHNPCQPPGIRSGPDLSLPVPAFHLSRSGCSTRRPEFK